MDIDFRPNPKQAIMLDTFENGPATEVAYGGAASGGKSYGLCALHIIKSLQYPGVRSAIGRDTLKNLKRTTLKSFFKVCKDWQLKQGSHFKYNQQDSIVTFYNGSEILLLNLQYIPSDPECEWLGSFELTFASIDEASRVNEKVKTVLHSRCGRHLNKHDEQGNVREKPIKPFILHTCNPARGWLYDQFYKATIDKLIKPTRLFIQALITDNVVHQGPEYMEHLLTTLSPAQIKRLVHGKWDFNDDPNQLTSFEAVKMCFDHNKPEQWGADWYITADVAFESDRMIIILWNEFDAVKIVEVAEGTKPEDIIKGMAAEHRINNKHIVYDATGVGAYLKNYFPGAYAFHSGAKPIRSTEFEHLKTQCYVKLSEAINERVLRIFDKTYEEETVDELLQIKSVPKELMIDKIKLIKKAEIKAIIGRSPDILDALAMRWAIELKGKYRRNF